MGCGCESLKIHFDPLGYQGPSLHTQSLTPKPLKSYEHCTCTFSCASWKFPFEKFTLLSKYEACCYNALLPRHLNL